MFKFLSLSLLLAAFAARANVLLTVDLIDLSAVTITATGAAADASDSSHHDYDGVTLTNFLTSVYSTKIGPMTLYLSVNSTGSTLAQSGAFGASDPYYYAHSSTLSGSYVDLTLQGSPFLSITQVFDTTDPAFTGMLTLNLAFASSYMPTAGTTGDIYSGDTASSVLIGQYAVVKTAIPEPATTGLLVGAGALAAVALHRFSRSRRA